MNQLEYEIYLLNYPDLRYMNKQEAEYHYHNFGQKEGRALTINTEFYTKFYNVNDISGYEHYRTIGKSKGYLLFDDHFYLEDLTLQIIMDRRKVKFERIKDLIESPYSIDDESRYIYISDQDEEKYNIKPTENVSSNR